MAKNNARNELARNVVTYRELTGEKGIGFVLRVLNNKIVPATITTTVRQPGHSSIAIETVVADQVYYPGATLNVRYRGGELREPESLDGLRSRLEGLEDRYPLAGVALEHLVEYTPEPK